MYLQFKKLKKQNDQEAFERLCQQLNEEKNCIKRSSANWKRIFSEWESKVKAKARRIHFEHELTGGGIPIIEILTNLEKKLLEVLSKILIYGHPQVVELGFKKKSSQVQTCTYKTSKTRNTGKNRKEHLRISSNFSDDQPYSWSQKPFHPTTIKFKNAKVCTNPDGTLSKNLICPVVIEFQPYGTLPDIESMEEAVSFLKYRNKSQNNPYFLAVGFHKPHIPFKFPESYLDFHPLENISLPSNRVRPSLLPDVAWNPWTDIRERDDIKKLDIPFPYGPVSDDVLKKMIQAYYASVSYVDDLIGKVLKEVNLQNTIIILTGDHGWSLGQHGEFSKYSNFEEATHVPLIIHVPNLSKHTITVKSLVELVDIFPTLVDLTQVSEPLVKCPKAKKMLVCTEGESLLPVMLDAIENQNVKGKSAIFTQYPRPGPHPTLFPNSDKPHLHQIEIMGYSIKTKRYRYGEWVGFNPQNFTVDWTKIYGKELYDHLIDPEENMNLAERSELQKIVKHLKKKLHLGWRYA